MAALLDHLWQSTLFAGFVLLLTLALSNNGARVRFWLWFAASVKFLVPFAALAAVGESLSRFLPVPVIAPQPLLAMAPAAERISAPVTTLAPSGNMEFLTWLLPALWVIGFALVLGVRLSHSFKLRALLKHAQHLDMPAPVSVKASSSLLEPGLVGIFKPVVLLPKGLLPRLSADETQSILAHELTHLKRRDNLTSAIHMWVEAIFWFYPPVWLIGARLIAERERACDESVLARGHDPEVYAEGILKVCKFCLQSPLSSASGVSGGNLGQRVREIMTAPPAMRLNPAKKTLLTAAAVFTVALPVMGGFLSSPMAAPMAAEVRRTVATVQARASNVLESGVSVVAEQIGAPTAPVEEKRLPRLKLASVPQIQAVPPSFTVAPTVPVPPPVIAAVPSQTAQAVQAATAPNTDTLTPLQHAVRAIDPRGEGDPDQITCRVGQSLPGSRLRGPEVCKPNRVWAQMAANKQVLSPDGQSVLSTTLHSTNCADPRMGSSFIEPDGRITVCK
ncbi:MAG TPA: M56 family metallopeptidase [Rhizomicrobium sp.]|jgi:beta-lactamase regulating signal transducer with metallopeptidase domain|nr:M56 family metallopeptidase [Rhizomicrobium sp.]